MTLNFGNLIVFSAGKILLFIHDLVVDDPVGLITYATIWISFSVTPGFSWISAEKKEERRKKEEKKKEERRKKADRNKSLPHSRAQELFVLRVRGNPSLR